MKIQNILATKGGQVVTIRPTHTLKEATLTLAQYNIGAVVVTDESEKIVGIISERDIVRAAARDDRVLALKVGEVMTKKVITATPQDDLMTVVQTMTERRFRHLPIVDGGKLVGIVSIGDMVKTQLDESLGEIDTLQTQIIEG